MLTEWLIAGGFWFWIVFAICSFALWIASARECDVEGTAALALFLALWLVLGDLTQWLAWLGIWWSIVCAVLYVLIGLAWCVPKWWSLLRRLRKEVDKFIATEIDQEKVRDDRFYEDLSYEVRSRWRDYGLRYERETHKVLPPTFADNRFRLVFWTSCWPWSLSWSLLRDPFAWLVDHCEVWFQRMSDRMFHDVVID